MSKKYSDMHAVHLVRIMTPKGAMLYGYWIGALRPKRVVVWVHGLGSSMFSKYKIGKMLAQNGTAVLMFNNRGHDKVASIQVGKKYVRAGAAHEIFTDSADDIQGAINFARRQGKPQVFLAGHSTGCQKSMYWASKRGKGVKGVIILAPMSDFAAERMAQGTRALKRAETLAKHLVRKGKKHQMLPEDVWRWPWVADAQRFLSLYTGNSEEEIFTYWDPSRSPRALRSVKIPTLVLLAEKEEFSDIAAKKIAAWFEKHLRKGKVVIVPRAKHSFKGGEGEVVRAIQQFMRA